MCKCCSTLHLRVTFELRIASIHTLGMQHGNCASCSLQKAPLHVSQALSCSLCCGDWMQGNDQSKCVRQSKDNIREMYLSNVYLRQQRNTQDDSNEHMDCASCQRIAYALMFESHGLRFFANRLNLAYGSWLGYVEQVYQLVFKDYTKQISSSF